jgi:hypothetical protein
VVSISECGSHAMVDAQIGPTTGKGSGEQTLARRLYPRLEPDWLLIADRNFYNFGDWRLAAATGAQLLWRVKADLGLPLLGRLGDGSYLSVLINPRIPALDASLTVVAQPQGQEVQAFGGVFEGSGSVTGQYRGKPVTGQVYVEQLGNWR